MHKIFAAVSTLALGAALAAVSMAQTPAPKKAASPTVTPRSAGEFVIHMPGRADKLLSSYRGKVVVLAFMYTTCPHCQKLSGLLAQIQNEYAAKGAQILGATFDPDAKTNVANFDKTFGVNFPCGYSTKDQVLKFLHIPENTDFFVPMLAFIDRTGTVRAQWVVTDQDESAGPLIEDQVTSIPKEIDKYLKPSASAGAVKQAPKS